MSKYLKKIETKEDCFIRSTSGKQTVVKSKNIFHGINMSFEKYAGILSEPADKTFFDMYEITTGSTLKRILLSLELNYERFFFTQNQIVELCKNYPNLMGVSWTYIPFMVDGVKKIAYISKHRDELTIHEGNLEYIEASEVFKERLILDRIIVSC